MENADKKSDTVFRALFSNARPGIRIDRSSRQVLVPWLADAPVHERPQRTKTNLDPATTLLRYTGAKSSGDNDADADFATDDFDVRYVVKRARCALT